MHQTIILFFFSDFENTLFRYSSVFIAIVFSLLRKFDIKIIYNFINAVIIAIIAVITAST